MTEPKIGFRVPAVRRAIRLAHAEQLVVGSVDIKTDGSVHLAFRPYEITPDGSIRAVADEAAA